MPKTTSTAHDQNSPLRDGGSVLVSGTGSHGRRGRQNETADAVSRGSASRGRGRADGPMDHGPRRSADESGPESHIFRGED
ncbi:hypothetical protein [Streptomyces axinellae]|uniref:Uncharacterized protein n=1 Tax=Streptomyces axinellae TaxID=552788 RepID=A0ABN3QQ50_9ACTN